jgi:hypothetical protein
MNSSYSRKPIVIALTPIKVLAEERITQVQRKQPTVRGNLVANVEED